MQKTCQRSYVVCERPLIHFSRINQGKEEIENRTQNSIIVSFDVFYEDFLMRGSCHIRSVVIGVKFQNCCQTLDAYLSFTIWIEKIQSKLLNGLVSNGLNGL